MNRAETMTMTDAWTREEFEKRLRERGTAYHIHHAFNVMLNTGKATPQQIRGWVANRYYYQIAIPIKDAAVLSNCPEREVRRQWVQRILDHDGHGDDPGGIEAWVKLGLAVGLKRLLGIDGMLVVRRRIELFSQFFSHESLHLR